VRAFAQSHGGDHRDSGRERERQPRLRAEQEMGLLFFRSRPLERGERRKSAEVSFFLSSGAIDARTAAFPAFEVRADFGIGVAAAEEIEREAGGMRVLVHVPCSSPSSAIKRST